MNKDFFEAKGWKYLTTYEEWMYFVSSLIDGNRYMLIFMQPYMYIYYQSEVEGGFKSEEIFGGRCMSVEIYEIISQTIGIDKI